ncbi:MAG: peptide-methionine (S)-S-oxide reductase MsrA [Pontibacterium sp.]
MSIATFAAGCFWGIEVEFTNTQGVTKTTVGYMGGALDNPAYKDVCSGNSGHAEVVLVEFDPAITDYEQLLNVFWQCHNPTTLNRQGPDIGSQYRSAIFFHDDLQQMLALESLKTMDQSGVFASPIVTEIVAATQFWPAEEYHQQYLAKRGLNHCHL